MNVNTLDEVPDSSWFTNRIGRRRMSREALVRGPDRQARPDIQDWPIVAGKAEGVQPGYRVQDPEKHLWQIEFDPPSNPEMASAAEVIGTAFYHALGYNVVEVYITDVDPAKIAIAPNATDAGRSRRPRRALVRARGPRRVLARAARRPDGRVRVLASRFADGSPLGSFRYDGQRPDDPNDVFPHEHRRELRANRVFAAWLNHDDSRGLNSLDMLERAGGKAWVKHYMFDFGSIMGSGTVFAQKPRAGNEYIFELKPGLLTALTFGLYSKPWITSDYPDVPASVGRFEGTRFQPEKWKPEYPNPAFENMRPEDAFWGARLVARFTPEDVAAVVAKGEYSDPAATAYVTQVLLERRRKVLETWLNGVTPLVEPAIVDGVLHAGTSRWPKAWPTRRGAIPRSGSPGTTPRGRASPSVVRSSWRSGDLDSAVAGRARQPRGGRVHWSDRRRRAPRPPGLGRASGDLLVPPHSRRLGRGRDHSRTTPGERAMSRMRHSNRRSRALLTAALVALPPVVPAAVGRTAPPPSRRRSPARSRPSASCTATGSSTTTSGCARRAIPRSRPTSRRRTPTPTR